MNSIFCETLFDPKKDIAKRRRELKGLVKSLCAPSSYESPAQRSVESPVQMVDSAGVVFPLHALDVSSVSEPSTCVADSAGAFRPDGGDRPKASPTSRQSTRKPSAPAASDSLQSLRNAYSSPAGSSTTSERSVNYEAEQKCDEDEEEDASDSSSDFEGSKKTCVSAKKKAAEASESSESSGWIDRSNKPAGLKNSNARRK